MIKMNYIFETCAFRHPIQLDALSFLHFFKLFVPALILVGSSVVTDCIWISLFQLSFNYALKGTICTKSLKKWSIMVVQT